MFTLVLEYQANRPFPDFRGISRTLLHDSILSRNRVSGKPGAVQNAAETALEELEAKWGDKYPMVIQSWRSKWPTLSAYFKYPEYVRKAIYTTNAVEAVHRQFRKLTKTKGGFANENSLLKLLYAGILKASERWTHPIQNWNLTLSQLAIHFPGRLDEHISL